MRERKEKRREEKSRRGSTQTDGKQGRRDRGN
jgi:hypothetical protein